ncbi:hypothetical protein ACM1RC_28220 [Paenibacillus azoreducens]|uniref:hypothetical protein n=1 Tax=Paenibacillus azoreducens TaxID=116718 RepID=UPI0039F5EAD9
MLKKWRILILLVVFGLTAMYYVYIMSESSTTAGVTIAEVNKNSIVVVNAVGEKTKLIVPRGIDTSCLNKKDFYFVDYYSNIFRKSTLREIHKAY